MEKDNKEQEIIEAFSALMGDGETSPNTVMDDPDFIRDPMSLKTGDFVDIEVTSDNYKRKFFAQKDENTDTHLLYRRTCRIAGEAASNYHGLGYFVSPLMASGFRRHNNPFAFYINEYGTTWAAFRSKDLNDEDNNSRQQDNN